MEKHTNLEIFDNVTKQPVCLDLDSKDIFKEK